MSDSSDDMEFYSGLIEDDEISENELAVLRYCYPHLDQMWAAKVCGLLLGVDFRDAKSRVDEILEDYCE